jgi:hypothetical protein
MTTYINIDERYGENVPVVLEDYQALNPDAEFYYADTGHLSIAEMLPSDNGVPRGAVRVAVEEKEYLKSIELYRI